MADDEYDSPIVEAAAEFREVLTDYLEEEVDDPLEHLDGAALGLFSAVSKYDSEDWCEGRHLLGDALMYIEHFAALTNQVPVQYWDGIKDLSPKDPPQYARNVGDKIVDLVKDREDGADVGLEQIDRIIEINNRGDFWNLTQLVYYECYRQRWDIVELFEEAKQKVEEELDGN